MIGLLTQDVDRKFLGCWQHVASGRLENHFHHVLSVTLHLLLIFEQGLG
jgi:hypothetical protein